MPAHYDRLRLVACTALVAVTGLLASPRAQSPAPSPGLDTLAHLERLPRLVTDAEAHYVSSFDRTGGNDDGFRGTYSALYVNDRGEHVLLDAKGPGVLSTLWFTSRENGWAPLGSGRIRFYVDDEAAPRLDLDVDELFSGRRAPFLPPFVFDRFTSTGGYVSYLPMPFQRRLVVATEKRVGFYNAFYQTFAAGRTVESWTGREDVGQVARLWNQPGVDPKPALDAEVRRGTVTLAAPITPDGEMTPIVAPLAEWDGAGAITALTIRPLFPLTAYQLTHVRLRAWWDGEVEPAVDVPLGNFFGSGLGEASVRAVPLGMSPSGAYYCYLPMPFWSQARLALVNDNPGPVPAIAWEARVARDVAALYPKDETGYFHAEYRREWPTTPGRDYTLLDTTGSGVLVGQVMTVEPLRPEVKRWWEGDLRVHVDTRRSPSLHGTGHEDEYLGGWSNEWLMNPYSLPMHGEPASRDLTQVDFQWNAATTVYRFFPGGIPYLAHLSMTTEHGVANGIPALYSSVAYYYQRDVAMRPVDVLDVGDAGDERRHQYRATPSAAVTRLESAFEGADDTRLSDDLRAVGERSRFTLRAPGPARALRLRRRFDQSAIQEAEVWINGARAGVWYAPATNATRRWADADFMVPAAVAAAGGALEVEIRVVRGPWREARYELWSLP